MECVLQGPCSLITSRSGRDQIRGTVTERLWAQTDLKGESQEQSFCSKDAAPWWECPGCFIYTLGFSLTSESVSHGAHLQESTGLRTKGCSVMCCFFKKRSTCLHSVWLFSWKLAHIIGSTLHQVSSPWCHRAMRRCVPSVHLRHLEKQTRKKLCPHQSPGGPGCLVWRQHARVAWGDYISVFVAVLTPQGCQLPSFTDGP